MNTGSGFTYTSGGWSLGWTPYVGDLDADGRDDVFVHASATGFWYELISSGTGGLTSGGNGAWAPIWSVSPTDFNADGRTDVLLYDPASGVWYQARNLTLGAFSYSTGTWATNLTIVVGSATSSLGPPPPAPLPLPSPSPEPIVRSLDDGPATAIASSAATEDDFDLVAVALADGPAMTTDSRATASVTSLFTPVALTLDLTGSGSGTITSNPAGLAACTGAARTCQGTFESGTVVTLTAAADVDQEFTGWSGACGGINAECTVTMSAARYVAAHFRVVPPMVTRYYHVDALGSVRVVTKEDGTEARRDDYHAFGEAGSPPQGDSIRFTGK